MTDSYPNRLVWTEIPTADLVAAKAFYEAVLGVEMTIDEDGPNPLAVFPYPGGTGASGHLYPGTPAKAGEGITAHLAVDDALPAVMDRVRDAGGEVVSETITIPAGSFFYAIDPDGNSVSFFKV